MFNSQFSMINDQLGDLTRFFWSLSNLGLLA